MYKRILAIFIMIILIVHSVDGFYNYENKFQFFKLYRDVIPANYTISFDETNITNKDVKLTVEFSKPVDIVGNEEDFEISENKMTVTKNISINENNKIFIRDEDFNYIEVPYNVDWIDKEPPKIIGAENGKTYNNNIHLNYSDNYNVKEIYANYYSDEFSIYTSEENFYETDTMQIVPATKNSITAYVTSNTRAMEKYNYYLNDVLYASNITDRKYTFLGLQELSTYRIKVEALDRYGNILETRETTRQTIPLSGIEFSYNWGNKYVAIKGTPSTTTKVDVYAWVQGHYSETYRSNYVLNDSANSYVATIGMENFKNYSGRYSVLFVVKYKDSKGSDVMMKILGSFLMPNRYSNTYYNSMPNDFLYSGNYYVRCIDEVGNESELDFSIKK